MVMLRSLPWRTGRLWWKLRTGRLRYRTQRSWRPSRTLRWCCRIGLHFMAWDLMRDQYRCECRQQYLNAETIRTV